MFCQDQILDRQGALAAAREVLVLFEDPDSEHRSADSCTNEFGKQKPAPQLKLTEDAKYQAMKKARKIALEKFIKAAKALEQQGSALGAMEPQDAIGAGFTIADWKSANEEFAKNSIVADLMDEALSELYGSKCLSVYQMRLAAELALEKSPRKKGAPDYPAYERIAQIYADHWRLSGGEKPTYGNPEAKNLTVFEAALLDFFDDVSINIRQEFEKVPQTKNDLGQPNSSTSRNEPKALSAFETKVRGWIKKLKLHKY